MNRFDLKDKTDLEVKELADSGSFIGNFEYGMRLLNQFKYKEAFEYLYRIKDHDNFFVWEQLISIAYYEEKGIISDEELVELLLKRHNKGVSHYTYILSYMYKEGRGVQKDLNKYIEYLSMCAYDGSAFATIELAEDYEKGFGVEKSLEKAFELYDNYVDEHFKMDFWCAYKAAYFRLNELGGAEKNMDYIKRLLEYAGRVVPEARKLYSEVFNDNK